jgi:hypothetical protein
MKKKKEKGGTDRGSIPILSQIPLREAGFPLVAVHVLASARERCIK